MRKSSGEHKRYRRENEVIERILRFVKQRDKALKTHIMYAANLNTVSLEKFLDRLIESGAIEPVSDGDKVAYVITPKGEQLLNLLTLMKRLLSTTPTYRKRIQDSIEDMEGVDLIKNKEVVGKSGVVYRIELVIRFKDGKEYIMDIIEPGTDLTEGVLRIAKLAFLSMDTGIGGVVALPATFVRFITLYYSGESPVFGASLLFVYYTGLDEPSSVADRICTIFGYTRQSKV